MNRELIITLAKPYAQELAHKLGVILDEPELLEEALKLGVTEDDLRTTLRDLDQRGGVHCFSVAMWQVLADEARSCLGIGDTYWRIQQAVKGIPRVKRKHIDRPKRAPGNVTTPWFINTSRFPDALVKQMISFILEGGRMPARCQMVIKQGVARYCSGRAYSANKPRYSGRGRAMARGGSVYVCANREHRGTKIRGGHGGYLPIRVCGATEDFFSVLAHEIRHVFQGFRPMFRECKKVRRHVFGTCAKLSEIDASLFEARALRRFRREWPSVGHKVLPLP